MQGTWVQSLVRELRSHMPWGQLSLHAKAKTQHSQIKKKGTNLSLSPYMYMYVYMYVYMYMYMYVYMYVCVYVCVCVYVYKRLDSVPGGSDDNASATMRETQVQSLGPEDPLEKAMATHARTLAWKIPWTEEPGRLQSVGLKRVGHD